MVVKLIYIYHEKIFTKVVKIYSSPHEEIFTHNNTGNITVNNTSNNTY